MARFLTTRNPAERGLVLAGLCGVLLLACENPAERQAQAEARARAARAAEEAATREEAERKATAARLEAEKKAASEQVAASERKAKTAVADCCQAIARRGFEERNMADMAAKKLCLELEAKGETLANVQGALALALEARAVPPACAAEGSTESRPSTSPGAAAGEPPGPSK